MRLFILVLLLFVNIYAPYSVVGPTIINTIIVSFLLFNGKIKKISVYQRNILLISFLLACWVIVVCFVNGTFSDYVIGRFFRIFINSFLLGIIINNLKFTIPQLLTSLGIVLLVNIMSIFIQALEPSTKDFFSVISGYEKRFFDIRSFGLYSSYDAAGLNVCFGLIVWGNLYIHNKKNLYIFLFLLTFLSSVFVSRYTMLIAGLIFLLYSFRFLLSSKHKTIAILFTLPLIILTGYYFYNYASPIIDSAVKGVSMDNFNYSYSADSFILLKNMFFFPEDPFQLFIGTGEEPTNSDVGFVKLIYMVGLLGLFLIFYLYFYSFVNIKKRINNNNLGQEYDSMMLYKIIIGLIILMFIYNLKLLLLYGRGFHDLLIILVFAMDKFLRRSYQYEEVN